MLGYAALFVMLALYEFARMSFWRQHHNPPFAAWHGVLFWVDSFFAFVLVAGLMARLGRPGGPISRIFDNVALPVLTLLGAALFLGGAVGFLRSEYMSGDFILFGATAGLGFYILKRTLSLKDG